jgi:ATP-dependent exoDNAse (exonuclease V) beta subunit
MAEVVEAGVGETKEIGVQLGFKGAPDTSLIGLALHRLLAAEIINPSSKDDLKTTIRLLNNHGVAENIDFKEAKDYADHFLNYLMTSFRPDRILTEYPVQQALKNGQLVKGWVDMLLETEAGWIIIDHKFTDKQKKNLEAEVLKYSGQLKAYEMAVEAGSLKKVLSSWIHFPAIGRLYELKL